MSSLSAGIINNKHELRSIWRKKRTPKPLPSCAPSIIPADSDDIKKEYKILAKELKLYNKELVIKPRIIGISKSDLLDDELKKMLAKELPKKIPHVFFSALANENIMELKDKLWKMMND